MTDVLVLNKGFLAINTMGWENAMSLLYQGHAEAVDQEYKTYTFDDWVSVSQAMKENPAGFIQTASLRIAIPDVIRLTRWDKVPSGEVKFTRQNIYDHYNHTCCYCGKKFPTRNLNLDHVVPRSRGGKTSWDNIVLSCIPCNKKKADKTPREAGMKLLVKPTKPDWKGPSHMVMKMPFKYRVSWRKFIDRCYWDSELEKDS